MLITWNCIDLQYKLGIIFPCDVFFVFVFFYLLWGAQVSTHVFVYTRVSYREASKYPWLPCAWVRSHWQVRSATECEPRRWKTLSSEPCLRRVVNSAPTASSAGPQPACRWVQVGVEVQATGGNAGAPRDGLTGGSKFGAGRTWMLRGAEGWDASPPAGVPSAARPRSFAQTPAGERLARDASGLHPWKAPLLGEVTTARRLAASAARSWSGDSNPAGPALCPPCAPFSLGPQAGSGQTLDPGRRVVRILPLVLSLVTLNSYLTS